MDPLLQYTNTNNALNAEIISEDLPLLIQEHQIFTLISSCFLVSILCYALSALQGKINARAHNGLRLFWEVMMYGEVISVGLCLFFLVFWYYLDAQDEFHKVVCAEVTLPFSRQVCVAYGWLVVWMVFIVSVLRNTTAVTWLHQLRTVEQLKDMGRGLGILMITLLYLFPVALLCRHSAAMVDSMQEVHPSVCLPVWVILLSPRTESFVIAAGYIIGLLVAGISALLGRSEKKSLLAIPIVLVTHFFPTYLFCVWATNALSLMIQVPASMMLIYCIVASLNSISNLFCYKLLPLASQEGSDMESQHQNQKGHSYKPHLKAESVYSDSKTFIV